MLGVGSASMRIREVSRHHPLAALRGGELCVRFFSQQYRDVPLTVQGPLFASGKATAAFDEFLSVARHLGSRDRPGLSKQRTASMVHSEATGNSFMPKTAVEGARAPSSSSSSSSPSSSSSSTIPSSSPSQPPPPPPLPNPSRTALTRIPAVFAPKSQPSTPERGIDIARGSSDSSSSGGSGSSSSGSGTAASTLFSIGTPMTTQYAGASRTLTQSPSSQNSDGSLPLEAPPVVVGGDAWTGEDMISMPRT